MPIFSCGGMRYQETWDDASFDKVSAANQANLEATVARALELGISHIETARGYGSSEIQLGRFLPKQNREKLIVQTKIAPQPDAKSFLDTFAISMRNLQLEFVDLLAIHGINNHELLDQTLRPGGSLDAARQLQREGRVRHIGFSTHAPLSVILATIRSGEFSFVNLHWYWIFQENLPAIEEAARRDMGVFIISPNDKGGKLYDPPQKLRSLCSPFSPMVFNNLFCLANPAVHTLSIGAARPTDFEEHLLTVPHLDTAQEALEPIQTRLVQEMEATLGRDWLENYLQDLPSYEAIPGEINIRMILRLWNLQQAFGMREYAKMRYNLLGNAGHWFPGRTAAEFEEAAILKALGSYRFADRIPSILREAHHLFADEPKKRLGKD